MVGWTNLEAGHVLDERYRLERLLGTGGMGEVWLAEDQRLGRWVAVKLLREDAAGGGGAGIEREARLVARLQHPNIVALYDAGHANGRPYLVMEYVHGLSLRELLEARGGSMAETEAVGYGVQVAGALSYAHSKGVFHSDVKPENVLVGEDGTAKALDFGIAQTVNRTLSTSEARSILGTVAYLAPEVIQGLEPDARSDIYALGLTVYEMVAGRLPFGGSGAAAITGQRLVMPAPPLRTLAPRASAELESVLARALAIAPAQRFGTAAEFGNALQGTRHGAGTATAAVVVRRARPAAPGPPVRALRQRPSRAPMFAAIAIAGAVAVVGGTVAALVLGGDDGGSNAPPPTTIATLPASAAPSPSITATRAAATPTPPADTPTPAATATTPTNTPALTPTVRPTVATTVTATASNTRATAVTATATPVAGTLTPTGTASPTPRP